MVSENTSGQPPCQKVGKRDKRLGYERTEPLGLPPPRKEAYVSPYKQAPPAAPLRASKFDTSGGDVGSYVKSSGQIPGHRSKAGSQKLYRNATVDELMARIGRSDTSTVPMSRHEFIN
jgi:hypothetical protein